MKHSFPFLFASVHCIFHWISDYCNKMLLYYLYLILACSIIYNRNYNYTGGTLKFFQSRKCTRSCVTHLSESILYCFKNIQENYFRKIKCCTFYGTSWIFQSNRHIKLEKSHWFLFNTGSRKKSLFYYKNILTVETICVEEI